MLADHVSASTGEIGPSIGTRFLVFPQAPYVPGYDKPELVWLSPPAGSVLAGPADDRMYVVEPVEWKKPYAFPVLPPYPGIRQPPAEPGPTGHFDHIGYDSPAFLSAHTYACARRVLDLCEGYVGRNIPWFFNPTLSRLEIIPRIHDWDNAQSGFGFLELGESNSARQASCFGMNFDSVAHEMGHLVLLSELRLPRDGAFAFDYFAYHEAVADFTSLIGLLHFDTAIDRILRRTNGNLLIDNELDRFAELSDEKQIRSFNNSLRMEDVGNEVHDRSKPFAAGLFDCLIEIYQTLLFDRGLSDIDPRRYSHLRQQMDAALIEKSIRESRAEYELKHFASKAALQEARDIVAEGLVRSWPGLDPDRLTFRAAAVTFLDAADRGRGRPYIDQLEDCMKWRNILQ
jgi:hypothetical protein